jgi:hypothetical protein
LYIMPSCKTFTALVAAVAVIAAHVPTDTDAMQVLGALTPWTRNEAEMLMFDDGEFDMAESMRGLQDAAGTCGDFVPLSNDLSLCPTGNCTYCPFTKCWKREGAFLGESANCDPQNPNAEDCADLRETSPSMECPEDLKIEWLTTLDSPIQQDVPFTLRAKLDFGALSDEVVAVPCGLKADGALSRVPHANVHGCVKDSTSWWCSELIPAYQPKSAKTSPNMCMNDTSSSSFEVVLHESSTSQPNEWTLYAHYYFFTRDPLDPTNRNMTKWHVTLGASFLVQGKELRVSDDVNLGITVAAVAVSLPLLVSVGIILWYRKHWVIRASSPAMCVLMLLGGLLGCAAALAFIPANLSAFKCQLRVWLLPLSLVFMLVPMLLKTWR